jgi:hypothetical protein
VYRLVDVLVHEGRDAIVRIEQDLGRRILYPEDWYRCLEEAGPCDLLVANDLFPNADQRLELFLERALPLAREVRLSLTFYDEPRFYMCRRIDAEEFMCFLAWSGAQIAAVMKRFASRIIAPDFSVFSGDSRSVFPNGRHVVFLRLRGNRGG